MVENLPDARLKDDSTMQVRRIVAPDEQWAERLVQFMYLRRSDYTNCNWHHNCVRVLAGEYQDVSQDVFFAGLLDDDIVGTSWYGTPRDTLDVATYGRIITHEDHRRKGIATVLCALPVDEFKGLGGRAMYLGTGRTNPARFIYERLGFEHYNYVEDAGTIMRLIFSGDPQAFEDDYYRTGCETALRPIHAGDLARAELLFNLPLWAVKDSSLGIIYNTPFEGAFFDILSHIEKPTESGFALVTPPDERMMGMAYTAAAPGAEAGQTHVRYLEFLVHPNYSGRGAELLTTTEQSSSAEVFIARVAAADRDKLAVIEEAGYRQVGRLERAARSQHAETDILIYQKT